MFKNLYSPKSKQILSVLHKPMNLLIKTINKWSVIKYFYFHK